MSNKIWNRIYGCWYISSFGYLDPSGSGNLVSRMPIIIAEYKRQPDGLLAGFGGEPSK